MCDSPEGAQPRYGLRSPLSAACGAGAGGPTPVTTVQLGGSLAGKDSSEASSTWFSASFSSVGRLAVAGGSTAPPRFAGPWSKRVMVVSPQQGPGLRPGQQPPHSSPQEWC